MISIHALLAESDFYYFDFSRLWRDFYPRSPCGERLAIMLYDASALIFLSTLSLRRATTSSTVIVILRKNFYPRSPCGERRVTVLGIQHRMGISIHALLAESDVVY